MINWSEVRRSFLPETTESIVPPELELPVFPQVVTEFVRRTEDPNCDLKVIAQSIEVDSKLTCELLRHVNSASIGRRHKATSAVQAITTLGIRRSKLFLLTAAVQNTVNTVKSRVIDLNEFWCINLERALFAREVAKRMGTDADIAYTGAMLQDFLLPALTNRFQQIYFEFMEGRSHESPELIHFERARFTCDHALAAGACTLQWSFPDELTCGILLHHLTDEELHEKGLYETAVSAIATSAWIPDSLNQIPKGIARLLEREKQDDRFNLLDIAEEVDKQFEELGSHVSMREPLLDRMDENMTRYLQQQIRGAVSVSREVGNYTLEEKIGEGAMGVVYKARHRMLKRPAAVKVVNKNIVDDKIIELFQHEVQMTSQLQHPNTIAIYDYGRTPDGLFYYAMEFLDGITLKELVKLYGPQPMGRVIQILIQVCGSLDEAHQMGVIHRDIKPENIMLTTRAGQHDFGKVLDFGLLQIYKQSDSLNVDENAPKQKGLCGTPMYLSPEAIDTPDNVDHRVDIYALGATAYYLLTGHTLYTGNSVVDICLQQVTKTPITPSKRLGQPIDADLEDLVMKCLNKKVEDRPESVRELAIALSGCQSARSWNSNDARNWWGMYLTHRTSGQLGVEPTATASEHSTPTLTLEFDSSVGESSRLGEKTHIPA
jgi:serine/threonine protein kinase/HD-like signal output (HDOD) protein